MTEAELERSKELSAAVILMFSDVPNYLLNQALRIELQKRGLVLCQNGDLMIAYNIISKLHDNQYATSEAYRCITNAVNGYIP